MTGTSGRHATRSPTSSSKCLLHLTVQLFPQVTERRTGAQTAEGPGRVSQSCERRSWLTTSLLGSKLGAQGLPAAFLPMATVSAGPALQTANFPLEGPPEGRGWLLWE